MYVGPFYPRTSPHDGVKFWAPHPCERVSRNPVGTLCCVASALAETWLHGHCLNLAELRSERKADRCQKPPSERLVPVAVAYLCSPLPGTVAVPFQSLSQCLSLDHVALPTSLPCDVKFLHSLAGPRDPEKGTGKGTAKDTGKVLKRLAAEKGIGE